ncbi:hypothetical protein Adeg_0091 [Ammonifex degensii KC4]|uniref:DUF2304 domain-containing protein n=1 Tax=Ammonifex degensii (strain DSM 10501 / KC4) TaxID=429009 RepID=C9RAJ0_AMMDK|nr:DUF2304 domain-containing protein [Ammonifex degensii]ACX51267.1 hypothetical protein Adeg_0091 [Ammonifex degensii KC4]
MANSGPVYYLTFFLGLGLGLVVLELVRRRWLRERYALLWLLTGLSLMLFSWKRSLVEGLARTLGIYYAPSALFLLGFFFLLLLNLQYAVALSRQSEMVVRLAQEVALLRQEILELRAEGRRGKE